MVLVRTLPQTLMRTLWWLRAALLHIRTLVLELDNHRLSKHALPSKVVVAPAFAL